MSTLPSWVEEIFQLPRPEYPKQAEALLTDLIWRSQGSILSGGGGQPSFLKELAKLPRRNKKLPAMDRLIPQRISGGNPDIIETFPIAQTSPIAQLIFTEDNNPAPIKVLLESILAPRSRGDRSHTCVPIHPQAAVLQTLHGLVNKPEPPNMAEAIEVVGRLGGSDWKGAVASRFLQVVSQPTRVNEGLTGLLDAMFPRVSKHVWETLPTLPTIELPPPGQSPRQLPAWPAVIASSVGSAEGQLLLAAIRPTPFQWFWHKWVTLCDPAAGWIQTLPTRRFIDWALCLLRTGLAFAYLWEADFFCKLHTCLTQYERTRSRPPALDVLLRTMSDGTVLATISPPNVPATQKDEWKALSSLLARGYEARERFKDQLLRPVSLATPASGSVPLDEAWLAGISSQDLAVLAAPLEVKPDTAKNTKYFVRYLLQPRSSDDDSVDQADFYYLARTNSASFWLEPGPEWLVVITGLLCRQPGGQCTLRMLLNDLATLGIRVERSVLVGMLEEAGLSMDSPDADEALVIKSAF
jgi:hypothetical protein